MIAQLQPDALIDVAEAATRLSIRRESVCQAIKAGRLPAERYWRGAYSGESRPIDVGRWQSWKYRLRVGDVDAYAASRWQR